jgi:hypothetical protein
MAAVGRQVSAGDHTDSTPPCSESRRSPARRPRLGSDGEDLELADETTGGELGGSIGEGLDRPADDATDDHRHSDGGDDSEDDAVPGVAHEGVADLPLTRWSSAPASRPATRSDTESREVSNRTGIHRPAPRSWRQTSKPSGDGIITSRTTASIVSSSAAHRASAPVPTTSTE